MRLLCVSCDIEFEAEEGTRPRCPSCRRVHGLERVTTAPRDRRRFLRPAAVLIALALMVGGYLWWASRTPAEMPDEVPLGPLDAADLRAFLADREIKASDQVDPFAVDARLRAFAEKAVRGKTGDRQRATALFEAFEETREAGGFVPFRGTAPQAAEVRLPPQAFRAIRAHERTALSSLELAMLLVAAAREVELPAAVVEVFSLPDERSPIDPTGYFGHFAAGVFPGEEWQADPILFDLHLGERLSVEERERQVLDDVAVAARVYSHRAMATLVVEGDSPRAMELSEMAGRLAPGSISILGARAVILLATGGVREGLDLMQRARKRRNDAVRSHNLATGLLAAGREEEALRLTSEALRKAPDYAAAHATLAAAHLSRGRTDQAAEELAIARGLDPDLDVLPTLEASLHLARRDLDRALASAREAVRRRPHDERALLVLASIHRERGEILAMRRALRRAVENSHQAEALRRAIEEGFGPTALDEEEDWAGEGEGSEPDAGPALTGSTGDGGAGTFQLGSKVLGREPTLDVGGPSRLRLGGDSGSFRLKLRP